MNVHDGDDLELANYQSCFPPKMLNIHNQMVHVTEYYMQKKRKKKENSWSEKHDSMMGVPNKFQSCILFKCLTINEIGLFSNSNIM